jgi:hypothetical protein
LNFYVHYLHFFGWVYVFYVGDKDEVDYETLFYAVNSVFTLIKLQYYKLAMSYAKQTNNNGYNYELFEDRDFK